MRPAAPAETAMLETCSAFQPGHLLVCGQKWSTRGSESHELSEGDEKKKRDSRKSGGFLNLIKSRSKTERPPTILMAEEPSSPKGAVRSPAVDSPKKDTKAAEPNGSSERIEEIKTPDSFEETQGEDTGKVERSDSKSSPQGGRRYGVQVMGSGLLAEMKAKQEKRAACAQKGPPVPVVEAVRDVPGLGETLTSGGKHSQLNLNGRLRVCRKREMSGNQQSESQTALGIIIPPGRLKLGNDAVSQDPSSPALSSGERLDGGGADLTKTQMLQMREEPLLSLYVITALYAPKCKSLSSLEQSGLITKEPKMPKLHPGLPENRFGLGTPEKSAKAEPRVEAGCRSRSSSGTPTSPKPLLQSPKPSLAARPIIPQKPRTPSRPGKSFAVRELHCDWAASQNQLDQTLQAVSGSAGEPGTSASAGRDHQKPVQSCESDES
ncbi:F-actin-uncapping protein LRRC16A [Saguinus oedipus]|uniref:F-actin-uncapping protein LRRC16A n=1 Tax=Saguinus oedipus TaxID=9490 RepID=A0ABQ9VVI7_SAGOE|nr:F-actin-uncapping protein LRRC16A [Saguinus oedipus]